MINEQVRIPPQVGSHKIYIIDEAHMLSNQAFNAFLKTLEEPLKHVIFILQQLKKTKLFQPFCPDVKSMILREYR